MVIEEEERVGPVTPSADAAVVVQQGLTTVAIMVGPAFPRAKASANATARGEGHVASRGRVAIRPRAAHRGGRAVIP